MADLTQAYKQIDWNLSDKKLNTELWGKENDNARGLRIRLINNSSVVTLSSEVMRVNFKKSDGTQVFSNCTISNNFFVLKMSEQVFAVPGIVECELVLQQSTDFVTSPTFKLIVDENLNTDIESSDEFTVLQEALSQVVNVPIIKKLVVSLPITNAASGLMHAVANFAIPSGYTVIGSTIKYLNATEQNFWLHDLRQYSETQYNVFVYNGLATTRSTTLSLEVYCANYSAITSF